MFLSVSELEIKKLRFDVAIPPSEIEYLDNIRQAAPVEAKGEPSCLEIRSARSGCAVI